MDVTVSDMLHSAARRWPNELAHVYAGLSHTWSEVDRRVDALAAGLLSLGVRPGDPVAYLSKDGPVLVELVYAAARIGAIRVGVNYRMVAGEVETLLRHCGARILFVQDDYRPLAPAVDGLRVMSAGNAQTEFGEYGELIGKHLGAQVPDAYHEIAQYCYTTGSTGRPKAAIWTHESINYAISHTLLDLDFRRDDVWLHCLPGVGVPCLSAVWNVAKGFTTVVMPAFEAGYALDLMEANRVSRVLLVPTMLNACCEEQKKRARDLSSVRCITYGSAPTPPALIQSAAAIFRNASFEQLYGATEACGGFFTTLSPDDHAIGLTTNPRIIESCGLPMQHTRVQVQRFDGTGCEPEEVGEVAVRGRHVMQGYLNEPELTAAAIRNGWLMTGDMGKMDQYGYLYLVDRKQFMIITGGYNVYPVEIENVIAAHPAVLEVCVFGVPDTRWGEAVHAAVVVRDYQSGVTDELYAWARERLAKYKVPKSIELRGALIRGATGKILKRAERDRYLALGR
ncbi:AMP-binding protein [Paraburkholderia xenovorans]